MKLFVCKQDVLRLDVAVNDSSLMLSRISQVRYDGGTKLMRSMNRDYSRTVQDLRGTLRPEIVG